MSWMGAFIKNIHAMIFRYLMYFDAQFSCLIQFISLEYTGPCIYMITKTEFIYKDVLQVINSLINILTSFCCLLLFRNHHLSIFSTLLVILCLCSYILLLIPLPTLPCTYICWNWCSGIVPTIITPFPPPPQKKRIIFEISFYH